MFDIIRYSSFGQLIRLITKNRVLLYPDEKPGFELPRPALESEKKEQYSEESSVFNNIQDSADIETNFDSLIPTAGLPISTLEPPNGDQIYKPLSRPIHPVVTSDGIILID